MTEIPKSLYLDEVLEICYIGERETYDLEVPDTHCYFGNGILIHNSADIEGDVDSIILIHRDRREDVNPEAPPGDGIFKPDTLIQASKARWGPGGTVKMTMDDSRCRLTEDVI